MHADTHCTLGTLLLHAATAPLRNEQLENTIHLCVACVKVPERYRRYHWYPWCSTVLYYSSLVGYGTVGTVGTVRYRTVLLCSPTQSRALCGLNAGS